MLTNSQQTALNNLLLWYNSSNSAAILHGPAGYGKTHLIEIFLKKLPRNVKPLLLADTNEAINVLKKVTKEQYTYATVCSALGLTLGFEGAKEVLIKRNGPNLDGFNLIIVDEVSTLTEDKIEYLLDLGKYILFVGHRSQLPPIIDNLRADDPCISPIFQTNFPVFDLKEPVRNTGEIFQFCQKAEQLIYQRGVLPFSFKVQTTKISALIKNNSKKALRGQITFLAFTNKTVDFYNTITRESIFGTFACQELFLPEEHVIFRRPTLLFSHKIGGNETTILQITARKNSTQSTNTRALVQRVSYKTVLGISCYELFVQILDSPEGGYIYVPVIQDEYAALQKKYYCNALYEHNPVIADRKWKQYHDLNTLFGRTKHTYALTIHCAQGSTMDTVIVDDKDIDKCGHGILKKKLRYVGYSRAKNNLFRI